jgi:hypothetical protein
VTVIRTGDIYASSKSLTFDEVTCTEGAVITVTHIVGLLV